MVRLLSVDGAPICSDLRLAHTHWTRMKGLLGSKSLPDGHGLWIKPCNQVHMYFMRYPVDLIFVDRDMRVVRLVENQPVNTISEKVTEAESVVEVPVGTIARAGVQAGATLVVEGETGELPGGWLEAAGFWFTNLLLAAWFGLFAYRHVLAAVNYGQWATTLPIIIQESLLVLLFLTRRRSKETSSRPLDWVLGIVGTALPLFLRPLPEWSAYWWAGQPFQVIGLTIALLGTMSLGRSVGVVAGNRGVKTGGAHGIVRHPMYAGYLVGFSGYLVVYPSGYNAAILLATLVALVGRTVAEERLLQRDPIYRDYMQRVRWRFLPYVY